MCFTLTRWPGKTWEGFCERGKKLTQRGYLPHFCCVETFFSFLLKWKREQGGGEKLLKEERWGTQGAWTSTLISGATTCLLSCPCPIQGNWKKDLQAFWWVHEMVYICFFLCSLWVLGHGQLCVCVCWLHLCPAPLSFVVQNKGVFQLRKRKQVCICCTHQISCWTEQPSNPRCFWGKKSVVTWDICKVHILEIIGCVCSLTSWVLTLAHYWSAQHARSLETSVTSLSVSKVCQRLCYLGVSSTYLLCWNIFQVSEHLKKILSVVDSKWRAELLYFCGKTSSMICVKVPKALVVSSASPPVLVM